MSSRWKKVWADFWGNRGRTFLTIMTIAVGTFAVGFNSNLGWDGNPHRAHAPRFWSEWCCSLADLHSGVRYVGKRAACKTGVTPDRERYTGIRIVLKS